MSKPPFQANQPVVIRSDQGLKTMLQKPGTRVRLRYTPDGEVVELLYRGRFAAKVERRVLSTMRLRGELTEVKRGYEAREDESGEYLALLEYELA